MFEIQGKYGTAKIFADEADPIAMTQVAELLNQPYAEGANVRMMPDIHAGKGCTIGTTMHIRDKICPNLVGVDISCGVLVLKLKDKDVNLERLDESIKRRVPAGFSIREEAHPRAAKIPFDQLRCRGLDRRRGALSIGTLGGGNHFIELNRDKDGFLYLVIHCGSRHLGLEVANGYQELAVKTMKAAQIDIKGVIAKLKKEGRQSEIESTIRELKMQKLAVPEDLAYVSDQNFEDYLHDMKIINRFADENRHAIADEIIDSMGFSVDFEFTTVHNYIDTDNMILRKGSVSAARDEMLIIPINMRDGSLICRGKGNPDWNSSAPHGAGRLMSRAQARKSFSVEEFLAQMSGIYTTTANCSTLDECPMAYKDISNIIRHIGPTAEIVEEIKPIYNFKAGE